MSQAFESIAQGLREALGLSQGEKVAARIHRPDEIDVAKLRGSLGLSQSEFAAKFGQQFIQLVPDSRHS
ncbi:MAG: hypothetical protein RL748_2152 [Pseudomonadota bacterium]|jgi:putative transcriptional regulator